jgi:hypothetical protein
MYGTPQPALASVDPSPALLHVLINDLGGLSGAALVLALIGVVIGLLASWIFDRLPTLAGIVLGVLGTFLVAGLV